LIILGEVAKLGVLNMATKSFEKNIVIKNRKDAERFISALEHASGKKSKEVYVREQVGDVKDNNVIRKIFKEN
jgi:hypothetical protein